MYTVTSLALGSGSLPRVMASLRNLAAALDIPAATPPAPLPSSAWHTDETDITAL